MRRAALLLVLWAAPAAALPLDLPAGARQTARADAGAGAALPAGPWRDGAVPRRGFDGAASRTAWAIDGTGAEDGAGGTVARIAAGLSDQLRAAGYDIAFACRDTICGGYDFRFALETLPAPAMFVDLADYRYVLATGPEGGAAAILVSEAGSTAYVQVTEVGAGEQAPAIPGARAPAPVPETAVWEILERDGHAVLDGLAFGTGSATLDAGARAALEGLARGLAGHPGARIALVGHTDTAGAPAANVALSRRRAQAVRQALIDDHGADPARITADGVGYLAPRASNRGEAGRRENRRVEAVLLD